MAASPRFVLPSQAEERLNCDDLSLLGERSRWESRRVLLRERVGRCGEAIRVSLARCSRCASVSAGPAAGKSVAPPAASDVDNSAGGGIVSTIGVA